MMRCRNWLLYGSGVYWNGVAHAMLGDTAISVCWPASVSNALYLERVESSKPLTKDEIAHALSTDILSKYHRPVH